MEEKRYKAAIREIFPTYIKAIIIENGEEKEEVTFSSKCWEGEDDPERHDIIWVWELKKKETKNRMEVWRAKKARPVKLEDERQIEKTE